MLDFETIKTLILDFLQANEAWSPIIVGVLAFGESLAFVSLLIPATVILIGVGALIGVAGLEFWPIWLGAAVGAILGDCVSYIIGQKFKYDVFKIWPLSRHPELVNYGERFFARWGLWGVFFGRFLGPARAVMPLTAGIFAMPVMLFQSVNVASAFVWSFVLLAPGAGLMKFLN